MTMINDDEPPMESLWVFIPFLLVSITLFWFLYCVM